MASNSRDRFGPTAVAFRGYNVTNLGRSGELLAHPLYGPIAERYLREASAICADTMRQKVDLVERVRENRETTLETYHEAIALIVAVELAQLEILEQYFEFPLKRARMVYGYSLGELTAVIDNNNGVADESLVQTGFGLRSSTGGLLGNISTMTLNPSFAAIPGSLVGTQSDTDADTDLDLINALASAGAGQQVVGSSFVLGTFTFTASGSATGITQIQVVPNPTNTLFRQDGTFGAGTTFGVNPGTPVTLTVVPEPVSLGLVGMAGLALMGRRRRQA